MKKLKYEIETISGIHIGVAMDPYEKGGIDSYTIKDMEGFPYIPASSIKGKFRFFLDNIDKFCSDEFLNRIKEKLNINSNDIKVISKYLFKTKDANEKDENFNKMEKVIFQDATIVDKENNSKLFEIKAENSIEIKNGIPDSNPRIIERTNKKIKYEFEILIIGFEEEEVIHELINTVFKLISEYGYLGGNGTRGYGRVNIIEKANK
ncbi:MAG: type III-A CRISPR-associated RAMP protein Csm3 [Mycoplasmatales bacterium]